MKAKKEASSNGDEMKQNQAIGVIKASRQ